MESCAAPPGASARRSSSRPRTSAFRHPLHALLGQFNYGRKGILDARTRVSSPFVRSTSFDQSGYKVLEVRGIPAPFPKALGTNIVSRLFLRVNQILIRLSKGVFSYQIFVRAEAKPTVTEPARRNDRFEQSAAPSRFSSSPLSARLLQDPQGMEQAARDQLIEAALNKENVVLSQIEDAQ